jgi:hypothetical protein
LKKEKAFLLLSVFSIALIAQDCDCFGNRGPRRRRRVRVARGMFRRFSAAAATKREGRRSPG